MAAPDPDDLDPDRDDPDPEPRPPDPARVAARAAVLAAVSCRGLIEQDAAEPQAEEFRRSVREWLGRIGADAEAEAAELRILDLPLGQLTSREAMDAGWRSEGLVVLAWALGRTALPAFSAMCNPSDVANALGFLQPREATVLAAPTLRAVAEIDGMEHHYLTVHWRIREFGLRRRAIDFAAYIAKCQWGPLSAAGLTLVDGELAIDGVALPNVEPGRLQAVRSIVQERHQALNWLAGWEPVYSAVTTDT